MKVLKISYYAIMIMLVAWFAISYIDIIADNCSSDPIHHPLNMIGLLLRWF